MDQRPTKVYQVVSSRIPSRLGEFTLSLYKNGQDEEDHLAYCLGEIAGKSNVLVRVHSECFTGDVLGSERCDCGEQLDKSLKMISEEASGVLIYLPQEGRGIGLQEKLRAYNLQDEGYDTVEANLELGHQADNRDYSVAAAILADLGVGSIRLMTNNPAKIEDLRAHGVSVVERIPIPPTMNSHNEAYLRTKVSRMNHLLDLGSLEDGSADQDHAAD